MPRLVSKAQLGEHQWVVMVNGTIGRPQQYLCESEVQAQKLEALFLTPLREHGYSPPSRPERPG